MLNKSCRVCGRVGKAICDSCKSAGNRKREAARPSASERGYTSEYRRYRRIMIDRAWANGDVCCICGKGFASKSDITAEHIVPLRNGGTGDLSNLAPAHLACNVARGPRF